VWKRHKRHSEELCSYGIALAAYALALTPVTRSIVSKEMMVELKSRIQSGTGKISKVIHDYSYISILVTFTYCMQCY